LNKKPGDDKKKINLIEQKEKEAIVCNHFGSTNPSDYD
jgi:hypothetical protein